ncbi:MAG: hypothetical protein EOP06_23450 [Proteobacteria bacterium]|nr:MAG: hypothetical protein EOP06_23450 [Pseudomonadota bacterium]
MKILITTLFSVCMFIAQDASAINATYELKWDKGNLPFEVKTFTSLLSGSRRIGETGIVGDATNFPGLIEMKDAKVLVEDNREKTLILMIKNTSKKRIKFSVAPHSTKPGESALGFSFQCLCNGHIYEVGPNELWYRIMKLTQRKNETKDLIVLEHAIFEVTPKSKLQAHHH